MLVGCSFQKFNYNIIIIIKYNNNNNVLVKTCGSVVAMAAVVLGQHYFT